MTEPKVDVTYTWHEEQQQYEVCITRVEHRIYTLEDIENYERFLCLLNTPLAEVAAS